MSLKKNILANYVSQLYVTLIGILMVPLFIGYMGNEAYGLVGFFAMLQAWFQLADMGLTPTMARATARFNGGASEASSLRQLLRALEGIFIGMALLGTIAMMAGASAISTNWLKVQQLPLFEVERAIVLMSAVVGLRWVCGLYRGVIAGFERMVWLSVFNIIISTARFVLVVPFFVYVGASPTQFFSYQLALAVVELVVLVFQTYHLLPKLATGQRIRWQWAPLQRVLRFSLGLAFTGSVWVLVTQTDKLVLSTLLPLADYANFTLAVLVASGVMVITGPISGAVLPRLTKLVAEGDQAGLICLYRNATQMVAIIAIPVAAILAFFSEQVLWAWTGHADIARQAAPILRLYAIGNGILALGAFPYYLQFAKGDLKLHLIGNAWFVILLIPLLIWATTQYGVIGAGWAWVMANIMYFVTWIPIVHGRFVNDLHCRWLVRDIGAIAAPTIVAAALVHGLLRWPLERAFIALGLVLLGSMLIAIAASGSSFAKGLINSWITHSDQRG